jgi:hypothetical protein
MVQRFLRGIGVRRAVAMMIAGVCIGGIAACGGDGATGVSEDDIQRAQSVLEPFKTELQAALREGLREGGPEGAIEICRDKAPQIAAAVSPEGVKMGRTSHRLRNPKNAAPRWVQPLLVDYLEKGGDRTFRAVRLSDGSVGYVEPIYVQPMCLQCHGREISPAVSEKLGAAYPHDNGKGFDVGDFRGVYWVRVSPSKKNSGLSRISNSPAQRH